MFWGAMHWWWEGGHTGPPLQRRYGDEKGVIVSATWIIESTP